MASHAVGSRPLDSARLVITSISWVSRIEDAKESLLRSRWDLVIVDEAHKMAAYSADKKTLAYKLGDPRDPSADICRAELRAGKRELKNRWRLRTFDDLDPAIGD